MMSKLRSNDSWLSRLIPFGLVGQTKPHHYREMLGVLWENRTELPYAWNILNHGVCDGCSLGPYGLRDNVHRRRASVHDPAQAAQAKHHGRPRHVGHKRYQRLRALAPEKLRSLGRLSYPMIRRKGEPGFSRVSWDDALDVITKAIHSTPSHQMGFFATSRGLTNEVYYVFQKLARVLGTNNVDLCSRLCHAASVSGLKATLGIGAPTCSLSDFIGTQLSGYLRLRPCQQPAGHHQVHALRQKSTARASPSSIRCASMVWNVTGCHPSPAARCSAPSSWMTFFKCGSAGTSRLSTA